MDPKGTIVFTSVGRQHYGFDVFSLKIPSNPIDITHSSEHLLTDGISINFNGQFLDEDQTLVYVSERTGSSRLYLVRPGSPKPELLPSPPRSLFHDRPVIKDGRLYFISAHEPNDKPFKSWSALYSTGLHHDGGKIVRLTPSGSVDYSPAISRSGKLIAVASYGARPWAGDFHDLQTDIVVFRESDPTQRTVVCEHGGWPTWSGDSTVFFHRQADDGWWSIFRVDLPPNHDDFETSTNTCIRVTPPGVHSFTPAALQDGKRIAVATRRRGNNYRHIEIFDLLSQEFHPVTELVNPNFHHYNPFVSPDSGFIGYHRFRGESAAPGGDSVIPHLDVVASPVIGIQMLRLNGTFPSFSPDGDLIAFNHDFDSNSGLKIVKSDGSKRWTLLKDRTAFYNSWCPAEKNVIFTSLGPIFAPAKATVQIARISFDLANLDDQREEDIAVPVEIKLLTREDTGNNAFPSCSPDGKFVVFRSGRSGHKNLYIVDAVNGEADGGVRQLTEGPWIDTMPSWSPDGKLIAFSSNMHNPDNVDAFSIYVVHPDGSGLRRIYLAGAEGSSEVDRERINHVCFSADGEWLVFTANLGGITAEPVSVPNQFQPYGDLHVARLDGSGVRRLTWNGYENGTPTWYQGVEPEMEGGLGVGCCQFGDKLKGQFDEPLWIQCDF
ncbi:hypothetical protein RHGRI_035479 [Rhododendron griersonianum]|uniref:Uncharacterized protein n=1 Tax=Rhododendron griersonianum TaxID=479676 RepID=A0AAV6HJ93_9ERIC|nr:hypothetical protein RHGRI_035479 [Rhododendron griersonianum]